jgi:hypothetical protein
MKWPLEAAAESALEPKSSSALGDISFLYPSSINFSLIDGIWKVEKRACYE